MPQTHSALVTTPGEPPKPRPLANDAYKAELSFAQPAPAGAAKGATVKFIIHVRNTGAGIFPAGPSSPGLNDEVRLAYHILDAKDKKPVLFDGLRSWLPASQPAGAAMDLPIEVKVPDSPGRFLIVFDLVHEGITWFETRGNPVLSLPLKVF